MRESIPPPGDEPRPSGDDARDAAAYIRHADRMWAAESENADRYARQVRLLTTLCASFIAVILYRLTAGSPLPLVVALDPLRKVCLAVVVLLAAAVMTAAFDRRFPVRHGRRRVLASRVLWMVLAAILLIVGWRVGAMALVGVIFAVAMVISAGAFLLSLYLLLRPQSVLSRVLDAPRMNQRPDNTEATAKPSLPDPGPPGAGTRNLIIRGAATASSLLELSLRRQRHVEHVLTAGELAVFARTYKAALDLQERNLALRDVIRLSQQRMTRGILYAMFAVLALVLATVSGTNKDGDVPEPIVQFIQ